MDEILYRQLEVASCSQTLLIMRDISRANICWRTDTAGCQRSRKLLEDIDDSSLTQVVE